jgi:hypothetical protein
VYLIVLMVIIRIVEPDTVDNVTLAVKHAQVRVRINVLHVLRLILSISLTHTA